MLFPLSACRKETIKHTHLMEQNEIDLHKALELFFSSTHGSPVSIVYMHYNGRSRTSRGPVRIARARARKLGTKARGRLLSYVDTDTGSCRNIYQACLMFVNDKKVSLKKLYR